MRTILPINSLPLKVVGVDVLQVRKLGASDARSFQAVRLNGLRLHPDAFGSSWKEEAGRPLDRVGEALEAGFVLGCERAGALVALAGFRKGAFLKTSHRGVIWGMYVEPEGRRVGVASLLLGTIIDHARSEVEDLTLAVAAHNEAAIALYRKFGFVEYGLDRRALKIDGEYVDEILMHVAVETAR